MNTLKLTIKRKWFDMIASGKKTEEYREPSKWIHSRVNAEKFYDQVEFRNGYSASSPVVTLEYKGFRHRSGREDWGADPCKNYVVILLGKIIPNAGGKRMSEANPLDRFVSGNCGNCHECLLGVTDPVSGFPMTSTRMILCPTCGNKRCPKASDHRRGCTDSNAPGQPGSVYR